MAVLSGTYKSYENVGTREDLSDRIFDISPEETPVMSRMSRGSISNTHFEWQTDSLASPDGSNAVLEGDEATYSDPAPTVRLGNYAQISRKTAMVSGTVEATDRAGRKSEMAFQMAKRASELKRDMETIITSNQAAEAGGAAVIRKTAGLLAFIKSNVNKEGTGVDPVYTNTPDTPRTDGVQRPAAEADLKDVIAQCWASGATPDTVIVGAFNKQAMSAFAGIATKTLEQRSATPSKIIAAADIYVSDFGKLNIVPDRFSRPRDALVLDFDYLQIDFLRKFKREKLAKTGDADKEMLLVEWGVRVKNEAAEGLLADLSTS